LKKYNDYEKFIAPITSCSCSRYSTSKNNLKKVKTKVTDVKTKTLNPISSNSINNALDISAGLKEALNKGISEQVTKLIAVDGFYKNDAVKILMPEELQMVDASLRKLGMGNLADDGVKALNRAAEDAVKEATPIFVNAVTNMNITDAKNILLGNENAATSYLQNSTSKELYSKFSPVVQQSIGRVGADVVWASIIKNTIPFLLSPK